MFTILHLLRDGVTGSGWCALSLLACTLIHLAIAALLPGGWKAAFRFLAAAALLCDLLWHFIFYSDGSAYANHGLAAVQVFLLWPALLSLSLFLQKHLSHSA